MSWTTAETNKHQDHVIAHVIGATPLGHFIHDETAYVLLDIGFIWNIYLDVEMGLVPERLAMAELEGMKIECVAEDECLSAGPIESVELFEDGDERRLVLICEQGKLVIETSLSHRWTRIAPSPSVASGNLFSDHADLVIDFLHALDLLHRPFNPCFHLFRLHSSQQHHLAI